jgi:hypothetical protein
VSVCVCWCWCWAAATAANSRLSVRACVSVIIDQRPRYADGDSVDPIPKKGTQSLQTIQHNAKRGATTERTCPQPPQNTSSMSIVTLREIIFAIVPVYLRSKRKAKAAAAVAMQIHACSTAEITCGAVTTATAVAAAAAAAASLLLLLLLLLRLFLLLLLLPTHPFHLANDDQALHISKTPADNRAGDNVLVVRQA